MGMCDPLEKHVSSAFRPPTRYDVAPGFKGRCAASSGRKHASQVWVV